MINQVVIQGTIGKPPEFIGQVGKLNIYVPQGKDEKGNWRDSHWFECVFFGVALQQIQDLEKGDKVLIVGKLAQSSWTPKGSNTKTSKVNIVGWTCCRVAQQPQYQDQDNGTVDASDAESTKSGKPPWM